MPKTEETPTFHCVICGEPISDTRMTRKAVTCSDAHANDLKNARRRLRDMTRCRLCNRPSTPEERASFAAWRKTQPQPKRGPHFKNKPEPAVTETLAKPKKRGEPKAQGLQPALIQQVEKTT